MCVDSGREVWGCSLGPSACRMESTDLLLRRKGARRRKLPGEWGICTRALWEGTTVSPGDSQGGTLDRMLGSSSGENTGLSIPRRKVSGWSAPPAQPEQQERGCCLGVRHQHVLWPAAGGHLEGQGTCLWGFKPSPMLFQPSLWTGRVAAPSSEQRPQPATYRCTALGPPVPQSEDCAHFWGSRGLPLSPHLRGSLLLCPW